MANKQTTGARISELGVRTVLAYNLLIENHVSDGERQVHLRRIEKIGTGESGVSSEKVVLRSIERCATGMWN